jgi:hypothetical protein|nr:hypothetical protein [uncultured Acetatifactor sp.]
MSKRQIFEAVFLALTAVLIVAKAIDEAERIPDLYDSLEDKAP